MQQLRKIFCVIDPMTTNQRALKRAADIAANARVTLHVYACMAPPPGVSSRLREPAIEAETERYEAWLERLAAPYRERGITVDTEVECQEDWREALAPAAARAGADLIVKGSFRRNALRRRLLKTGDWALLRAAKSPVLFVKSDEVKAFERLLVAINLNDKDEAHRKLNEALVEYSRFVAGAAGAELHAVNAYSDTMQYVHPPDLARRFGIERRHAHVSQGAPEKVLAEVTEEIGAALVMIGTVARTGVAGAMVGNTAERILDNLEADVLCIVQSSR